MNVGASFGTDKTDFNAPGTVTEVIAPGIGTLTIPFAGFDILYPGGFVGGGQIGYNWQFSPILVVGLEPDFQGIDEKEGSTLTRNFTGSVTGQGFTLVVTGSTALDYQTKIDWFGTVRPRIGYVWGNGAVLTYVTGGLAYGKVDVEGTNTFSATVSTCFPSCSVTQAFGHSQVNTGWVVGSGTEGSC